MDVNKFLDLLHNEGLDDNAIKELLTQTLEALQPQEEVKEEVVENADEVKAKELLNF